MQCAARRERLESGLPSSDTQCARHNPHTSALCAGNCTPAIRRVCARSPEKIGTLQHCAQPSTATPSLLCLGVQVCEGSTACSFCAANSFARFPLHAAHFSSLHIMRPEMPQIILCDPAHWPLPPHLHNCNAHNFLIRSGLYQLQCGLPQ